MCVYCMIPDWGNKWLPYPGQPSPWQPSPVDPYPFPQPPPRPQPPAHWTREMVREFENIIERVRLLEEKAGGCPCPNADPSKLDFLQEIKNHLDRIERKVDERQSP